MIEFDPSRCKIKPFDHQIHGIKALLRNPAFALFDQMGAGKSAQVVNAACALAEAGEIDTVVIVAPASVRTVWLDAEIGEIRKHSWTPSRVMEFANGKERERWCDKEFWSNNQSSIYWIVTNYELLRSSKHLDFLLKYVTKESLLICDESSYLKSRTAQQTKAIMKLRQHCKRVVLLNGTPVTHSPIDLFSQMKVLSPKILGDNFFAFRAEYCEIRPMRFGTGRSFMQVTGYKNLEKLTKKCAPYVLRRLKADCLDLPSKLYTVREVALSVASWKRYQELKKEAVATLPDGNVQLERNAATRIMRLSQLTSGYLGKNSWEDVVIKEGPYEGAEVRAPFEDLSSEKLDWCVQYLTEECTARYVIVWTRWRRERERLAEMLKGKVYTCQIYGGQSRFEREEAIQVFSGCCDHAIKHVLLAQPHAGGFGLNLVAASECIYLSNDWSLGIRLQSEDRCHRPGQKNKVLYTDVIATGPKGERTVDHTIYRALQNKQDLSKLTTDAWRRELA